MMRILARLKNKSCGRCKEGDFLCRSKDGKYMNHFMMYLLVQLPRENNVAWKGMKNTLYLKFWDYYDAFFYQNPYQRHCILFYFKINTQISIPQLVVGWQCAKFRGC
ncbi:hypothetical protein HS088_TW23G00679 [Tripterygium wilfordii]|uniref:Uncharacterized protein n=1 Tax=Tripterygium wilfordii TaxID=458696 RepID=A0A7J7BWN3_TRIWF|nr:hypothetical protein HS088_TW23G00679 [Tripterygium wilfordii]